MSVGGWPEVMRVLKASEKLLKATLNGDAESVAEGLIRHTPKQRLFSHTMMKILNP